MKNLPSKLLLSAAIMAATPSTFAANSIAEAFQNGKTNVSFRLRFEEVDVDNRDKTDATTLKSRITYVTDTYNGFGVTFEVDDVTSIGQDDDEFIPPSTTRGIINDREATDVNQAFLSYTAGDTALKLGRQRIILDNQRFIGGVAFRQNEQTFDAASITNTSLPDTKIFYAYVTERNTINDTDEKHETHLFNAKYSGFSLGTLSAYYYDLDQDNAFDIENYGIRFTGWTDAGDAKVYYTAEYATQDQNNGSKPDYYLLEGAVKASGIKTTIGYEVLESDNGNGFATPLATLHKFQGWADVFLNTPAGGIEDLYLKVGTKVAGVKLLAVYHDYESENTSADLGSEFGFLASKKFGKNYWLSLKYADYESGDAGSPADTSRVWLTGTAKF